MIMHLRAELRGGMFGDSGKDRSLMWGSFVRAHRFYNATNTFGARVTVEHYSQRFIEIHFNNTDLFPVARTYRDYSKDLAFAADVSMDGPAASRAKQNLRPLIAFLTRLLLQDFRWRELMNPLGASSDKI
jgi:hypothetical protein